jgi:hypothetical protein
MWIINKAVRNYVVWNGMQRYVVTVTTARRVLKLRVQELPRDMGGLLGGCKYIE